MQKTAQFFGGSEDAEVGLPFAPLERTLHAHSRLIFYIRRKYMDNHTVQGPAQVAATLNYLAKGVERPVSCLTDKSREGEFSTLGTVCHHLT